MTFCYPNAYTCDNFRDVVNLQLHEPFLRYVREAFRPLGVNVNFWQPRLQAGAARSIAVMMVNDHTAAMAGRLALSFETERGKEVSRLEQPFSIPSNGQQTLRFDVHAPQTAGKYLLKAVATPTSVSAVAPTVSRRKVTITQ